MTKFILSLLQTPSAFWDDWKKYARNQILHTLLIGYLPVYLVGMHALPAQIIWYSFWEWVQWRHYNGDASDGFEDMGFVLGASLIAAVGAPYLLVIHVFFLLSGINLRIERRRTTEATF